MEGKKPTVILALCDGEAARAIAAGKSVIAGPNIEPYVFDAESNTRTKLEFAGCEARQFSDRMKCWRCNLSYDANDLNPPICSKTGGVAPASGVPNDPLRLIRAIAIVGVAVLSLSLGACVTNSTPAPDVRSSARAPDPNIHSMVTQAATSAGVPVNVAHAVVRHESGYKPRIRGRAGEYGLGQIKCATARGEGFTGHCSQLADPATNLRYSMPYLRKALDSGGVWKYNAGIGATRKPRSSAIYERAVLRGVR